MSIQTLSTKRLSAKFLAGLLLSSALAAPALAGDPDAPSLLPPVANPGECYGRFKVPAQYATRSQSLITQEGYQTVRVRQPVLQAREQSVMVKEPSTRFLVRQPQYRTVTEQMLVRPAYDKLSVSPPQFSTVTERVQTSAPQLVWKLGNPAELRRQGYFIHSTADGRIGGRGTYDQMTPSGQAATCAEGCEIWCLVEERGKQTTVTRKVMSAPARVARTPVPARYQTITKQVLADPGGVEEIPVPAEYRTVRVEDVVDPGGEEYVSVPPEYGTIDTQDLITPERYEWRRVICATGQLYGGEAYRPSNYSALRGAASVSGGHGGGTYQSGATLNPQPETAPTYAAPETYQPRTGYYGTEGYPAYHNNSPTGAKRYRRRH